MFVNVDWFFLSHRLPIAKSASQRNYEFKVFTDFTEDHSEFDHGKFSFLKSPITRSSIRPLTLFKELTYSLFLIIEEKPDIIHAVTIKPIVIMGIVSFILRKPFVASISGLGPAFKPKNLLQKVRLKFILIIYFIIFRLNKTSIIVQNKDDFKSLLTEKVATKEQIKLIKGSGIILSDYKKINHAKTPPIKILMASRLIKEKGIFEYCSAASDIQIKNDFNVEFFLAGPIESRSKGGISEKEINDICSKSKVKYIGNRKDLPNYLGLIDIFVLPSYYPEGVPKVLLEASASGCAIITTDHPGCRDAIIENISGLLVRPRDAHSLYKKIYKLLINTNLIEKMANNGIALAQREFDINLVINDHFDIYKKLHNY
tara:strand:+ start:293 stop:1408 length:1116 start_codon:yes stop_codon:yes gene_type:complete